MHDGITKEPINTERITVSPAWRADPATGGIGCWADLSWHAPEKLPEPVLQRLRQVIELVHFGVQVTVILTTVLLCLCFATPFAAFATASLLTPGTFCLTIPIYLALLASPRLTARMSRAWPYRRACSWGLRLLARKQGQGIVLEGRAQDAANKPSPASPAIFSREERVMPGPDDRIAS